MYSSKDFFLHTFRYALSKQGISVPSLSYAACPRQADTLFIIRRPLEEVLKRALKKSDNLCAEALFFHVAMQESKDSLAVGFKQGQEAIYRFMEEEIGHLPRNYSIVDGSGVSLYNYISPELLLSYLRYAYYRPDIFRPLYEALPIAGIDGTLQHRMKQGKAFRNVRAKTGSVTGVSSLAGYMKSADGHTLAFVIINQNVIKPGEARKFQDRLCEILAN